MEQKAFHYKEIQGRQERLAPGHRMCAGCGGTIAVRNVLKALHPGDKAVIGNATGCLEVSSYMYPYTAYEDSYIGYLSVPDGVIIDLETMNKYPPEKIVLITTGSQGEPMSALTRMAMNEHRSVTITPMDYIIISANPIPGNEKYVTKVVNELLKAGAEVIYESMYDVHVSGHACQEEIKLIMSLTRPRFFIPVHGEYKHLKKSANLAYAMGIPESNVIIGSIGDVIETDGTTIGITGKVQAGRVLVDGLGVGDVGSIVLRDRKHLAEDGLIVAVATIESESGTILAGPDILSRGFVYVRENEEMMEAARDILRKTLESCLSDGVRDWNSIKSGLRDSLSDYIYMKTKRNPMILPIIEEI